MKKHFYKYFALLLLTCCFGWNSQAQIVEIESTTEGFILPRMTTAQRDAIGGPNGATNGTMVFNTSTGKINYYDALSSSWLEVQVNQPNPIITYFLTLPNGIQTLLNAGETPLNILNAGASIADFIGLKYQGGLIFYMEASGTGLVAYYPENGESTYLMGGSTGAVPIDVEGEWGCYGTDIPGTEGTAIYTGNTNTTNIAANCSGVDLLIPYIYNMTVNGYDDWFVPSVGELHEIFMKIGPGASGSNYNIGDFDGALYWSSSGLGGFDAYVVNFSSVSGDISLLGKDQYAWFRPIRAF